MTRTAAVAGGGIAGLVAARDLARAGWRVHLHERTQRLGGTVASALLDDGAGGSIALDVGAESFATRTDAVAGLAEELGLERVAPIAEGAWLVGPAGAHPLPRTGLLGIPGDLAEPGVRAVLGRAGVLRARLDRHLPVRVDDDASLAEVVIARMGHRVLDRLVAPVAGGVYSTPPERMPLAVAAPGLAEAMRETGSLGAAVARQRAAAAGTAVAGLRGGMHTLVEALAADLERLGATVHLGSDLPGPGAADLTVLAGAPTTTDSGSLVIATLLLDAPALDTRPRGTGVLVARRLTAAKALTHSSAKWPWLAEALPAGRHVVRLSYPSPRSTATSSSTSRCWRPGACSGSRSTARCS
ncbi:protoporphyrinogen/coproporphyrinogen oxidase [Arenivirga flava]|uniref:Protoporphyrinogen oxidase n=1 Tax=Arenivirga flava TaxID=1930060 RepID=A0AA37XC32_9MICO|nr:FAD-dependent oxidoreductase [Arenivirga flava]GMA29371.1 protoporphyrinogen oxidase [Arenivirga flava]